MTDQNVVVPDCKPGINGVTMTVAMANSSLFSPVATALPKPSIGGGGGGGHITISRTNLSKNIEFNNGGRPEMVNAWVESMRDSSPTRKSSLSQTHDHKTWILQHPSALGMFEEIIKASIGKQIVLFLDYDGTLSPIVEDPEKAFMTNEMREAVRDVAKYFPTAIVSGRCRAKVYNFVKLSELFYAGSHGMDIKGPSKGYNHRNGGNHEILFQPAKEFVPIMNNVYKLLLEKIKIIPGAKVENNKFCLTVHFRGVDEKLWEILAEKVKSLLQEYPKLRLTHGRKVLEIRPTIKWDKGKALKFLLQSLGYGNSDDVLPVYIGDDKTDEDAFKVLREKGQGFGILVSKFPKETSATYSLEEPLEVMHFLQRLVEWKISLGT